MTSYHPPFHVGQRVHDLTSDDLGEGTIVDLSTHYHDHPNGTAVATVQWDADAGEVEEAPVSDRYLHEIEAVEA